MSEQAPAQAGQANWINTDGTFGTLDTAPETVRDLASKKGWKGVEDIAKGYSELEKFRGVSPERLLTLPDKPDDVDGWNNVWNKLGRPESPDKYSEKFKAPDGLELSKDLLSKFKQYAHGKGMSDGLFNDVVQFQLDASAEMQKIFAQQQEQAEKEQIEQIKAARMESEKAVREKYGWKKDEDWQNGTLEARKLADKLGIFQTLEKKQLSDDPEVISMLVDISRKLTEDALPNRESVSHTETKEEAMTRISNNPAFLDKMHPDHEKVVKEFQGIFRRQS